MKKYIIFISLILTLCSSCSNKAYCTQSKLINTPKNVQVLTDEEKIRDLFEKITQYSNGRNIEEIKKIYASNYVSGDGLKKDDVINLTKSAWTNYPNLTYKSDIKNIRVNPDFATVETIDTAEGITQNKSDVTSDFGILQSITNNITYLQKSGKIWKIISDKVNYEKTIIKYGSAKKINIDFYAPEQVYSGEEYTASLRADLTPNMLAIASITREPIVYPQTKTEEVFRQVPNDTGLLERVMKSNITNNNEIASASLGLSEVTGEGPLFTEMKVTGVAVMLQRVNIIPKSQYNPLKEVPKNKEFDETVSKQP